MAFSTVLHLGSAGRPRRRASGQPTAGILTRRDRTARPVGDRRGSAGSGNRTMPRPPGPDRRRRRTGGTAASDGAEGPCRPRRGTRRAPARTRTGRWPTPTPGPSSNRRGSGNDGAAASSSVRDTRGARSRGHDDPGSSPPHHGSTARDQGGPGRITSVTLKRAPGRPGTATSGRRSLLRLLIIISITIMVSPFAEPRPRWAPSLEANQ